MENVVSQWGIRPEVLKHEAELRKNASAAMQESWAEFERIRQMSSEELGSAITESGKKLIEDLKNGTVKTDKLKPLATDVYDNVKVALESKHNKNFLKRLLQLIRRH